VRLPRYRSWMVTGMHRLPARYGGVPGQAVTAILILVLAIVPGAVGARIDSDVYQEQQQDLALSIQRGVLWLVTAAIIVFGAVLALEGLRTYRLGRSMDRRPLLATVAVIGALLGVVVGGAVFALPAPQRDGEAKVRVADAVVGEWANEVTCYGHGPDARPTKVASTGTRGGIYRGDGLDDEWFLKGSREGPEVRLLLELPADGGPAARAEVAIGPSVYRSTDATTVVVDSARWDGEPGSPVNYWPSGTATFADMPLVSGPRWGGQQAIALWIRWACSPG
jgi:hypothetical protein